MTAVTAPVDLVERRRLAAARRSYVLPAAIASVCAASVALGHAFTSYSFLPTAWLFAFIAFGAGWAGRRLDVPAVLSPFVSLLVLALVLGWVDAMDTTAYGVPGGETISAVRASFDLALTDVRELAAPVPASNQLTLLAASGVYLVAMVVDLVCFRLRRPVGAGLALLALYIVPASVRPGMGIPAFLLGAGGFIGLLIAEGRDRARSWGRRLAGRGAVEEFVDVSPVSRVGRRLGAAAIGVALVVPVFVPDLGDGLLGTGGSVGGFGSGPSERQVINPIVQLQPQLRRKGTVELMRVRTDTPAYLRLTSLDRFDSSRWSQSELRSGANKRVEGKRLPRAPGLLDVPTVDASYSVSVKGLDVSWLPAPYAPTRVNAKGDWRYDSASLTVFSARTTTKGLSYTVRSRLALPSPALLDGPVLGPNELTEYRQLPQRRSRLAQSTLDQVTKGRITPFEKVVAIQNYLRGPDFTYNLNVPQGNGSNALDNFLTNRVGYCEQFAATMAYLVRLAGIPARVAIGFTPGRRGDDGVYSVTNQDAHAWPEVYFANVGWLAFEPTPRADSVRTDPPAYAQLPTPGGGVTVPPPPAPTADPSVGPLPSASASQQVRDPEALGGNAPGGGGITGAAKSNLGLILLVTLLVGLVVGGPAGAHAYRRRLRWGHAHGPLALAGAAWDDLADAAEDVGAPMRASDSPRAAARRLVDDADLDRTARAAVAQLAQAEERARYAPDPPTAAGLREQVRTVRHALLAGMPWRSRVRATLLPPSTLRAVRSAVAARAAAAADWWDATAARLRQSVVSRLRSTRT